MKRILQLSTFAFTLAFGVTTNAQITNGDFEYGYASGTWTEASTNFGSPLCDTPSCGDGGGSCIPNTGAFFVWFGGAGGTIETASMEQSVFIPLGTTASINLFVKIAKAGPGLVNDRLEVSAGGTILATVTANDSTAYSDYTLVSVDVSLLADGNTHTFKIEGFQTSIEVFNILVDDITLTVDGGVIVGLFEEYTEPKFKIYPSPAKDVINLTFGEMLGETVVTIISIDGTIVSTEMVSDVFNKNFVFDTESMENGVYLVQVLNNEVRTTQRIVVSK